MMTMQTEQPTKMMTTLAIQNAALLLTKKDPVA